jgi:threonine aldolase
VINLYSDTQTRPTPAMRRAMAEAEVGDEQRGEDPTVNALTERVADLLGHDAAVFLPSGTMCNAIAFRLHVRPGGDEVVLHRTSHPIIAEAGGPAAISGAVLCPVDGAHGMFDAATLRAHLRTPGDRYEPRSRLVSLEQTTNIAGGRVWPLEQMRAVLAAAREAGMRSHLDGARLMNAVVASGVPAREWAGQFDTAWIDFTKGLGAPVGAVLAGSRDLIEEAWRYKQMWGGALRQAGVIAAAGLYALDHHVARLAEDHDNARRLAEGLAELPGIEIDPGEVETNIVVFGFADPAWLCAELEKAGVLMGGIGPGRVRAVTHLDVDRDQIDVALAAARAVLDRQPVRSSAP